MAEENQIRRQLDPRAWLLHCLIGMIAILLIHSEIGIVCLLLYCIGLHTFTGKAGKAFACFVYYLIFTGIAWAGVKLVENGVVFSVSSMLSSIGIIGRKALIPLSFAICLAEMPTGSLMAALQKMHFPKAVGIATAVVLRFFPTISVEYRAIRSAQRFRGIGVGVFRTLIRLPSTIEYILIPMILRTTRVAEELSASMTVRGVRFSGTTVSYRSIRFTGQDGMLCITMLAIVGIVWLLERSGVL